MYHFGLKVTVIRNRGKKLFQKNEKTTKFDGHWKFASGTENTCPTSNTKFHATESLTDTKDILDSDEVWCCWSHITWFLLVNWMELEIIFREIDYATDLESVITLYVKAFEDQKLFMTLSLARGEKHIEFLRWLFEKRLFLHARRKETTRLVVGIQDGRIVAAVGIEENCSKVTSLDLVVAGMLWIPFLFGFGVFTRVLAMSAEDTAAVGKTVVDTLGGKVVMMAVEPSLQGKGIGGKLLRHIITQWDAENRGELSLLTQLESNTRFYSKFGFELTSETKKEEYTNWTMRRIKP